MKLKKVYDSIDAFAESQPFRICLMLGALCLVWVYAYIAWHTNVADLSVSHLMLSLFAFVAVFYFEVLLPRVERRRLQDDRQKLVRWFCSFAALSELTLTFMDLFLGSPTSLANAMSRLVVVCVCVIVATTARLLPYANSPASASPASGRG